METKEWVIITGLVLSFVTAIYAIGAKAISAWERVEREKDKERIEAIVKIAVREMVDEVKKNYVEALQLIKSGTFK